MTETRILAGAAHVFPAGTIPGDIDLDDRHNTTGNVTYQIGVGPVIVVPFVPNQEHKIVHIHGQQVSVNNGLPSSLYCIY